ncbi:MAG: protein kinase [Alphaproteobacteria bacterium]|nr:protein kinase [Alphaproteobacteria bacterium]
MAGEPSTPRRPLSGAPLRLAEAGAEEEAEGFDREEVERYAGGGLLGRGGMGEVRSVQDRRLDRDVAMKLPQGDDAADEARLVAEGRLTARLEHPGIVPIYDAGRRPDGRPFYTMRIVRGRALSTAIADAPHLAARLRLVRHFLDACHAVAYAHGQGVVHRDLKPGNVMIGAFGETQVVDWGLAVAVGAGAGDAVGTPAYMGPRARSGAPALPTDDVHSLGVTLWSLLAGAPAPTDGPGPLPDDVPRELAAIVQRATGAAQGPAYADAGALAADIDAWFEGRRVSAYAYTSWDLLRRFWQAWRLPLTVAGVALVALALSVAVGFQRTAQERNRALSAEAAARTAEGAARTARARSDAHLLRALVAQGLQAAAADERAQAELFAAHALAIDEDPDARGILARFGDRPRPARRAAWPLPDCPRLVLAPDGGRVACLGEEAVTVQTLGSEAPRRTLAVDAWSAAFSGPDTLLLGTVRGDLFRWRAGGELEPVLEHFAVEAHALPRRDDGPGLLLGRGRAWQVREAEGDVVERDLCQGVQPQGVLVAADGRLLGVCPDLSVRDGDGVVARNAALAATTPGRVTASALAGDSVLFGTSTGALVRLRLADSAAVSVDTGLDGVLDLAVAGDRVAVSGARSGVWVGRLQGDGVVKEQALPGVAARVAWREDGTVLRVVHDRVEDWAVPGGGRPQRWPVAEGVAAMDLDPDGRRVALGLGNGWLQIQDLTGPADATILALPPAVIKDVGWSPDGRGLVAASAADFGLRLVSLADGRVGHVVGTEKLRRATWLPDGRLAVVAYRGPLAWLQPDLDARTAERIGGASLPERIGDIDEDDRDGGLSVLGQEGGVWYLPPSGEPVRLGTQTSAMAGAIGAGRVAVGLPDGVVVYDLAGGAPLRVTDAESAVLGVAIDPSGRLLAAGRRDGIVELRRLSDLSLVARLRGHDDQVRALSFTGDGAWLVTTSWDRTVRQWATGPLFAPADTLVADLERAWGRDLEQLLR